MEHECPGLLLCEQCDERFCVDCATDGCHFCGGPLVGVP